MAKDQCEILGISRAMQNYSLPPYQSIQLFGCTRSASTKGKVAENKWKDQIKEVIGVNTNQKLKVKYVDGLDNSDLFEHTFP